MLRVRELFLHRIQNDLLGQAAPNKQLVIAGSLGGANTSIVAAAFTAHLRDRRAALAANHGSREQMCGEVFLPTSLLRGESTVSDSAGPAPAHFFAAGAGFFPQTLWHDAQGLVLLNDPLGGRLRKASPSTRPRIAALLGFVPYPVADVFLVVEHAAHGGWRPTLARPDPSGHTLFVQESHDTDNR